MEGTQKMLIFCCKYYAWQNSLDFNLILYLLKFYKNVMHLLYYMLYKLKYKSVVECYRRALGRKTLSRLACLLSIVYTSVALFIIYK